MPADAVAKPSLRPLVIATIIGSLPAIAAGVVIGWKVLPSDAQAGIAVIFLGPLVCIPGAIAIGVVRPAVVRGVVALLAVQASLWLTLAFWAGLGALMFFAMLVVPTTLLMALVAATVGFVTSMFRKAAS